MAKLLTFLQIHDTTAIGLPNVRRLSRGARNPSLNDPIDETTSYSCRPFSFHFFHSSPNRLVRAPHKRNRPPSETGPSRLNLSSRLPNQPPCPTPLKSPASCYQLQQSRLLLHHAAPPSLAAAALHFARRHSWVAAQLLHHRRPLAPAPVPFKLQIPSARNGTKTQSLPWTWKFRLITSRIPTRRHRRIRPTTTLSTRRPASWL